MGYFEYDAIVVGGGHAGAEAAAAASRMGARTLLVTMDLQAIGRMSCNPAIGGIGKGHVVREIDALGGIMGRMTDRAGIQFRMLNQRKGPAVQGPRAQCDRALYAAAVREELESIPNLFMRSDMVIDLLVEGCRDTGARAHTHQVFRVTGVSTQTHQVFRAPCVILTSGTFMNGVIHVGEHRHGGGRMGERASIGLSACLERLGFGYGRLKTGTPPRVDGRTIDYSPLEEQPGDPDPTPFSFLTDRLPSDQVPCWLTHTVPEVHEELRRGFDRSPMFAGRIQGTGPRYCPSIEDKIDRFATKPRHPIFLEPEGRSTHEVYVNGFSTSLPEEVQFAALRKVPGLENVHLIRPGYAIEYDYLPPHQIRYSLETKRVQGLFFAGQINGTTGYEEAAGQGLLAGINAVRRLRNEDPLVLKRSEAYLGVLVDDLVAKGTDEPYRMFTSRAEHRLLLRQDTADRRLTPLGFMLGLASKQRHDRMQARYAAVETTRKNLERVAVRPGEVNEHLERVGTRPIDQPERIVRLARRPQVSLDDLLHHLGRHGELVARAPGMGSTARQVETDLKYEGYLERERDLAAKMEKMEGLRIPESFDYHGVEHITMEAREKLSKIRPVNLGQASRISGVSPADVSVLLVLLKKHSAFRAPVRAESVNR